MILFQESESENMLNENTLQRLEKLFNLWEIMAYFVMIIWGRVEHIEWTD